VVPDWIATALNSPDAQVRLQALDRWVQQGRKGSVDPLMLALNDSDERVRTRALQLIEQDWERAQAPEAEK
jgi:HEAT repeat protein